MTNGIYRQIKEDCEALFTGAFVLPVPAYWRSNDPERDPRPNDVPLWLRLELDFGRETLMAFGGGRGANLKAQFGSVLIFAHAYRGKQQEDDLLDVMDAAMRCYRSQRVTDALDNTLSFIGEGSGFSAGPRESGHWFIRGAGVVFEYRFVG